MTKSLSDIKYEEMLAEIGAEHQDIYQELWEIGQGRPYRDLNNDR